jgi:hypothetical protein
VKSVSPAITRGEILMGESPFLEENPHPMQASKLLLSTWSMEAESIIDSTAGKFF